MKMSIDMDMLSNPFGQTHLNKLTLDGVSGEVHRIRKTEQVQERRRFVIDDLDIRAVNLVYLDTSDVEKISRLDLEVSDWRSQPLSSTLAIYDLFFRSNVQGTLNQHPFSIQTEDSTAGKYTHWRSGNVPVLVLAQLVGGPFSLLNSGTVDVKVDEHWKLAKPPVIEFEWELHFKQINSAVPPNYNGMKKVLAQRTVDYFNTRPEDFVISFAMTMNESEFTGKSSLGATGLWKIMVNTVIGYMSRYIGEPETRLHTGMKKGIDTIKGFLDKRRTGEE
jgi:hypothetical protein